MAVDRNDGMNYAPDRQATPASAQANSSLRRWRWITAISMACANGLIEAGATLKWVYDPDPDRSSNSLRLIRRRPRRLPEQAILQDPEVKLVAAAAIPSDRGPLGVTVMKHGKDYFTDKTPFTTLEQLEEARAATVGDEPQIRGLLQRTAARGERDLRGRLIQERRHRPGRASDRHRAASAERAFPSGLVFSEGAVRRDSYDIGSHQIEQFLFFAGCKDAAVQAAK